MDIFFYYINSKPKRAQLSIKLTTITNVKDYLRNWSSSVQEN